MEDEVILGHETIMIVGKQFRAITTRLTEHYSIARRARFSRVNTYIVIVFLG